MIFQASIEDDNQLTEPGNYITLS